MKLISIIIPCFNVTNYLDKCIQSLVSQTIDLKNLELIFINDASTDDTYTKLIEYERLYPDSIMVVNLNENVKQGGARNIGISYSTAPFIGFVDSDDWIEATMYENLYQIITEFNCDVVSSNYYRDNGVEVTLVNSHKYGEGLHIVDNEDKRKDLLINGIGSYIWNKLFKKDMLINHSIYFPENLTYEDNFFTDLYLMYVERFYILNEVYYHYVVNTNSTVMKRNSLHHFDRLEIELLKLEEYKKRNILSLYRTEIQYNFIKLFYLNTMNIVFYRFDKIPYKLYLQMNKILKKQYPDAYYNKYLNEIEKTWLNVLLNDLSEKELTVFRDINY